jgi:hypothetical protein
MNLPIILFLSLALPLLFVIYIQTKKVEHIFSDIKMDDVKFNENNIKAIVHNVPFFGIICERSGINVCVTENFLCIKGKNIFWSYMVNKNGLVQKINLKLINTIDINNGKVSVVFRKEDGEKQGVTLTMKNSEELYNHLNG